MPFKVHTETDHHFIAKGNSGDIRIAKKGLTPQRHAAFQAMCRGGKVGMDEGGEVKAGGNGGQGISKDTRPDEHAPGWNVADKIHSMLPDWLSARPAIEQHKARLAEMDRQTTGMADGGEVDPASSEADALYQAMMMSDAGAQGPSMQPPPDVSAGRLGGAGGDFSSFRSAPGGLDFHLPSGGGAPPTGWAPTTPVAGDAANSGVLSSVPGPAASAPLPPPQVSTPVGGPAAGPLSPGPLQMGGMSAQQMQMYNPYGGLLGRLQAAERLQEQGLRGQAAAQGQVSQEQAKALEQHVTAQQEHEALFQKHMQALGSEHDAIVADIQNQHFDPQRVWSNKGTAQKASAILGMILGGIGSGLTHQPNAALAVLEKQIDRDIEAQKMDLGKKESLLADNFRQTGNLFHAEQLTRLQMSAALEGQMKLAAARSGSPMAQAQADQAIGQARQSLIGPMTQIAQMQAMYSMMGNMANDRGYVPSAASRPMFTGKPEEFLKDRNERRLELPELGPGAHTYAKSGKDAEEIGKSFASLSNLQRQVQHLGALAQQHGTAIHVPGTEASARYNATASSIVTELNKLQDLNRLNENEYKSFGNMIPTAREWFTKAGPAKLQELQQRIQGKRMSEYTGRLGIDPRFFAPRSFTPMGAQ